MGLHQEESGVWRNSHGLIFVNGLGFMCKVYLIYLYELLLFAGVGMRLDFCSQGGVFYDLSS